MQVSKKKFKSAIRANDIATVLHCMKSGINIHLSHDYAIRHAARCGYYDMCNILIENGCNITALDHYAIKRAAINGHVHIITLLIANDESANSIDIDIIKCIYERRNFNTIAWLHEKYLSGEFKIDPNIDINYCVNVAIQIAYNKCYNKLYLIDSIDYFIRCGAEIEFLNLPLLMKLTLQHGKYYIIENLLDAGYDINDIHDAIDGAFNKKYKYDYYDNSNIFFQFIKYFVSNPRFNLNTSYISQNIKKYLSIDSAIYLIKNGIDIKLSKKQICALCQPYYNENRISNCITLIKLVYDDNIMDCVYDAIKYNSSGTITIILNNLKNLGILLSDIQEWYNDIFSYALSRNKIHIEFLLFLIQKFDQLNISILRLTKYNKILFIEKLINCGYLKQAKDIIDKSPDVLYEDLLILDINHMTKTNNVGLNESALSFIINECHDISIYNNIAIKIAIYSSCHRSIKLIADKMNPLDSYYNDIKRFTINLANNNITTNEIISFIKRHYIDITEYNNLLLRISINCARLDMIEYVISKSPVYIIFNSHQITYYDYALHLLANVIKNYMHCSMSMKKMWIDICIYLLDKGANPCLDGKFWIKFAINNNFDCLLQKLINNGLNLQCYKNTLVYVLIYNKELVKLVLENGVYVSKNYAKYMPYISKISAFTIDNNSIRAIIKNEIRLRYYHVKGANK